MAVSQHIWHCGAGLPGDVLITDLRAYRYGPHFHDAWSIGAIDYGACAFTVRDAPHLAQAGDLVVIAPGDVRHRRHVRNAAGLPHAVRGAVLAR